MATGLTIIRAQRAVRTHEKVAESPPILKSRLWRSYLDRSTKVNQVKDIWLGLLDHKFFGADAAMNDPLQMNCRQC